MLLADVSKWIMLIIVIGIVVLIVKAGTKIVNILITAAILAFCWFSFFTEVGAARLSVALSGHPIIAYTAHLEKEENKSTDDVTYFKIDKEYKFDGRLQNETKCYTKWIVRIPSVGDFVF